MSSSSDGIRAKLERAKQHILDFERAKKAFIDAKPYRLRLKHDRKTGIWEHRIDALESVPFSLSVIAGDVVHNLRATLDYLVYELIRANGARPADNCGFPVFQAARTYRCKGAFRAKVKGMGRNAIKAIRLLKPYKRGNRSLWILHRLDIIDKHRLLLAVTFYHELTTTAPQQVGPFIVHCQLEPKKAARLKLGNVVLRHGGEQDMNPQLALDIAFDEPEIVEGKPVLPLLHQLTDVVENIVNQLVLFL
jgi:hypothetical protein